MSNVTTLASGQINRSDTIEIQLVEAGNRPPHVRILWPPHASVTTVAQLSETLAAAMRILANASTELNRRTAQQKECGRDPGSARCWAVLPVAAWLGIVFPFAMPRTKALPRRLLRIKSIRHATDQGLTPSTTTN